MDGVAKWSREERAELFRQAAFLRGDLTAEVVEKDFWVCWTLKHVFEMGPAPAQLIFKGGTSLSKVYGLIERFSEDVDLSISREDLGFVGDRDPYLAGSGKRKQKLIEELVARCTTLIADDFIPRLRARFESVLGGPSPKSPWKLALDDRDPQTVNFEYPPGLHVAIDLPAYVRPMVRLELGARSDHWPAETHSVTPYAADVLAGAFPEPFAIVRTLSAERTFWEKVTLLHAESHREADFSFDRMSRHYYDVAKIYRSPLGEKALASLALLQAVVEHKKLFFRSGWANYDTAVPGTFRLSIVHEARRRAFERDYEAMRENMIFGHAFTFEELLEVIAEIESRLNAPPPPPEDAQDAD